MFLAEDVLLISPFLLGCFAPHTVHFQLAKCGDVIPVLPEHTERGWKCPPNGHASS